MYRDWDALVVVSYVGYIDTVVGGLMEELIKQPMITLLSRVIKKL